MKSQAAEALCTKVAFQIQLRISGVNFSNNIPIPQIT